ncbi:1-(5-phosphoribosyl)-5-[(5-phosphoribosylamino)methylideneamino]imidazole-4-carboxamide isomerase [Anaerolineales bacterium HSG6]|nr:1-(5-phosphoribosyl)-5-[(5-phosphoribosylamino)methylideneamino]imidazole-4-carboxamide isomerase [Anaerolineales bacterium HSG6]MDM8532529.1 1-(5-phosphoribosyl)-5-[(5-phosphoribosylamino)methylideneamino]imidazole-4-carboxamide isomerase [Anaerolineales bacterium HSG25]
MDIYAAIDLKNGKCVRLVQGDPNQETIYSDSPAAMAERWEEIGVDWIHIVNLDGALGDPDKSAKNVDALQRILDRVTTPVQFGGGLRSPNDIDRALSMGVSRVVIGSMAADRPRQMLDILGQFGPEQVALGLDVRDGKVATNGWRKLAETDAIKLVQHIQTAGLAHVIHTDISRDGMLTGVNLEGSIDLAQAGLHPAGDKTPFKVIVSGGVADIEDVKRVKKAEKNGLEGLIIGKALYTGAIDLAEAMQIAHA